MLQADDTQEQATAELASREQALADARTKVARLERDDAGDKPEPADAPLADAPKRVELVQEDKADGRSLPLVFGSAVAALAGIGLITGAMLALTVDTIHVTTAGIIGAISGGAMLAVLWAGFVANWYRKHTMPVEDETPAETPAASNGSRPKPGASRRTS
jgi:hypothetical protein